MKNIRMKKDEEAVSPVIAVILMVAITVVLAAVLYVMVSGMISTSETTPAGSFTTLDKLPAADKIKQKFGKINPSVRPTETKLVIEYTGTHADQGAITSDGRSGTLTTDDQSTTDVFGVAAADIMGWSVDYTDLAEDKKVSDGDYLEISFYNATTDSKEYLAEGDYTITLIFVDTGDTICTKEFSILA